MAAEVLEQLNLAQSALGEDLLAEYIGDLLDGDALVGLVVDGSTAGLFVSFNGGWRGNGAMSSKALGRALAYQTMP